MSAKVIVWVSANYANPRARRRAERNELAPLYFFVLAMPLVVPAGGLPIVAPLTILESIFTKPDWVGRVNRHAMIRPIFDFKDNVWFSFELKDELTGLIGHGEPKRTFQPAEPDRGTRESTGRISVRQDLPA